MIDPTARTAAFRIVRSVPDSILGLRLLHLMAFSQSRAKPPGSRKSEVKVRRSDGSGHIPVTVFWPNGVDRPLPILVHLHGGGFAIGAPRQDVPLFTFLIDVAPCVVVAPRYRRSLEAPFPAALNDCHDVLVWARNEAGRIGGRSDQIMVMGESAGGGLTAALCLAARDRGEVRIAAQFPLYAMLDDRTVTTDIDPGDLSWSAAKNRLAWDLYLAGENTDPGLAAPARAEDLSGLPPAFGFVGDHDLFHTENAAYFGRLASAGVKTRFEVLPGAYHGVEVLAPASDTGKRARAFLGDAFANAMAECFEPQVRVTQNDRDLPQSLVSPASGGPDGTVGP